jgi:hypothetical protein
MVEGACKIKTFWTDLFKLLKMLPEEGGGVIRSADAQLNYAIFQRLLNVVLLDVVLAFSERLLLV